MMSRLAFSLSTFPAQFCTVNAIALLLTTAVFGQAAAATPKSKTAVPAAAPVPNRSTARTGIARDPYLGAIVVEASNGRVLFEDQPDAKGYPASVLKLMDLLI